MISFLRTDILNMAALDIWKAKQPQSTDLSRALQQGDGLKTNARKIKTAPKGRFALEGTMDAREG
jgi:hypothetical protein